MSDFDKEAERERLREQYEREQQKREATEQMSELLLKGATMTNAHCNECNDPIFRYDGREFCPTCQRVVTEDADAAEQQNGAADGEAAAETDAAEQQNADAAADQTPDQRPDQSADATADQAADRASEAGESADETPSGTPDHIEVKRPSGPAAAPADTSEQGGEGVDRPEQTDAPQAEQTDAPQAGQPQAPSQRATAQPTQQGPPQQSQQSGGAGARSGQGEASLSAARESLVRTLTSQARQAEACEDPRQAVDHLEAAREAAETLAALR